MRGQKALEVFEFGADFERLMTRNIQKLERERDGQCARRSADLSARLGRVLLLNLGKFCQIDLFGGHKRPQAEVEKGAGQAADMENSSRATKRRGNCWRLEWRWTRALQLLYAFCLARACIRVFYQYKHDFNTIQYRRLVELAPRLVASASGASKGRLQSGHNQAAPVLRPLNQTLAQLYTRRVQEAEVVLRKIGAPLMEITFGAQFYDLFMILMTFILYFQTQLYFSHLQQFDFSLIRSMLDLPGELAECNKLIVREMNRFVESSRNYTRMSVLAIVKQFQRHAHKRLESSASERVIGHDQDFNTHESGHLAQHRMLDHLGAIRSIETLALSGALMPCNRTSKWINTIAHYNVLACVSFALYCGAVEVAILYAIPTMAGIALHLEFMDALAAVEMSLLSLTVIVTTLFYGSLILTSSLDQVHLVQQLKRNINATMETNSRRYCCGLKLAERAQELAQALRQEQHLLSDFKGDAKDKLELVRQCALLAESIYTQMDADLLHVLLQYKIFVAQLKPTKSSYGFVSIISSTLMLLMPLIGCAHVTHVDLKIKLSIGFLSLLCAFVADVAILVPISFLYTRTAELYKLLASLLAHAVAVSVYQSADETGAASLLAQPREEQASGSGGQEDARLRPIYSRHAIWLLRKELNHPHCLADQFVTFVYGVRLSYSNLLRVHFWLGLLLQTMFFGTASFSGKQEFLGSLMLDPLGLL